MDEKELMTKKFILVGMDEAKISTHEKPIIGTHALATCIGVLLYSEEKNLAIVAHVSCSEPSEVIDKIFRIIIENKLISTVFKYKIIPGYYEERYNIKFLLEKYFSHFVPFDEEEVPENAIHIDEEMTSKEFAFDASTGEFVTDKVFFGLDYYAVNDNEYVDSSMMPRRR